MSRFVYGIELEDAVPAPAVERWLAYREARAEGPDDVVRLAADASVRIVDLPAPYEPGWREAVLRAAELPRLEAVVTLAQPADRFVLCEGCKKRVLRGPVRLLACDGCGRSLEPTLAVADAPERTTEAVRSALRWAAEVLGARGKRLFVENTHEPAHELVRLLDGLPEDVGIALDVGHAHIHERDVTEAALQLRARLGHLHFHDNVGGDSLHHHDSHLPPGAGSIPWPALARSLAFIRYQGRITFEAVPQPGWIEAWERMVAESE